MISIVCYYNVLSNWRNLYLIQEGELWGSEFMITAWSFTLHKLHVQCECSLLRESPWRNIMSRGSYSSSRSRGGTQEDRPPPHPLYFGNKLRRRKKFSWDWAPPPLSKAMDDCPPPLISRSESATVQWCWGLKKVQWEMPLGLHPLLGNI